jgi:hypothetical protein
MPNKAATMRNLGLWIALTIVCLAGAFVAYGILVIVVGLRI